MNKTINFADEISNYIFTSRYSRYNEKLGRRETWDEAVTRLEHMHLKKYTWLSDEDKEKIKWAFTLVRQKRIVPSMRSLQFGGKAIEAHSARIFNCSVRHIDSLRSFAEIMYLLLCGCGVGIGVTKFFLRRLPDLVNAEDKTGTIITYVVEDTMEGWADSIEALLNCYHKNTPYTGRKIVFDYSRIRKKGAPLKTGGGKAPGYKGLKETHKKIKALLDHIIEYKHQNHLKSIDAYDICMHSADAVLSGGIRRSATSVIFDIDDIEMINAKTNFKVARKYGFELDGKINFGGETYQIYNGKVIVEGITYDVSLKDYEYEMLKKDNLISWFHIHPQRGRSNNSVLLLKGKVSEEEFRKIVERTKQYGEPAFVWANHPWQLFNPCFEIGFVPVTNDGVCGVQFCNLVSQNGRLVKNKNMFLENCIACAIIGTLQAGYTNFPYLSKTAQELSEDEALLGCSITGMMDSPEILLDPSIQREGAILINTVNAQWAQKLKIKFAARTTCLKPEGTSTLVLSCGEFTASGIHFHHAKRYFRRVQCNTEDAVYKLFKKINPKVCEPSVWSANHTDDVIIFPVTAPKGALVKSDVSALKHLEMIKSTQENWVRTGTTAYSQKSVVNNVSCTVIVKENEWDEVISYIFKNQDYFAAVSLLSVSGDKDYPQAPMEAVITEKDEERWNEIINNFNHVDYRQLKEEEDNTSLSQEAACFGGACQII